MSPTRENRQVVLITGGAGRIGMPLDELRRTARRTRANDPRQGLAYHWRAASSGSSLRVGQRQTIG